MCNIVIHNKVYQSATLEWFKDALIDEKLCRDSGDLKSIGLKNEDLMQAIRQAMNVCLAAGLPIQEHFKLVYISDNQTISPSWKLSETAFKLVIVNANTANPIVANLQFQLVKESIK